MSLTERLRVMREARLKQIRDEKAWKEYERGEMRKEVHEEVRAEGFTQGRMEERTQIIRNMIKQHISDKDIIKMTGCSKEELKKMNHPDASIGVLDP